MTIEYLNSKWWHCVGDGYPIREVQEQDAWDLINKNKLMCTNKDRGYQLWEDRL